MLKSRGVLKMILDCNDVDFFYIQGVNLSLCSSFVLAEKSHKTAVNSERKKKPVEGKAALTKKMQNTLALEQHSTQPAISN